MCGGSLAVPTHLSAPCGQTFLLIIAEARMTEIADPKRRMLVSNDTTFFALAARGAPSLVVILGALAANLRRSNEEPRCMGTMTKR